ncbi:hypothetical protein PUP68_21595 [Pseudomonas chlororaphis]|uniref:hypothetical protein n=1 Tax=Pseudomonas chlororaphis TaxID=587753 RepID=UPI0023688260|nr:hypothetical protein [Pseudomonas chlororaphis]WDG77330.1 hypothetical protein PUP77_23265 [Pseudomonas chlororaphis]WDG83431.1 hypothetical protein PUP68_21595 [Pseudomonas chlororaphis]
MKNAKKGAIKIIEARISRSLRTAFAAALVIALVIPVTESILTTSTTGRFVMRSIDFIALAAIVLSLSNAYFLNRRLNRRNEL